MALAYNALLRNIQARANLRVPDFPARTLGVGPTVRQDPVPSPDPRRAQTSVKVNPIKLVADQLSPSFEGVPGRGPIGPTDAQTTGSPWYGPEVV